MSRGRKKSEETLTREIKWKQIRGRLSIVKLMWKNGYNESQICEKLGIDRATSRAWRRKYPEYAECFKEAEADIADLIEGKMIQNALGEVDKHVVHTHIESVTREVVDPTTGKKTEVTETVKTIKEDKFKGKNEGDYKAQMTLLKRFRPELYGDKESDDSNTMEPVVIVNNLPKSAANIQKIFFDDENLKDKGEENNGEGQD